MNESCGRMHVEVTDTFGGDANYSWVRRYTFDIPAKGMADRTLIRKARELAGFTQVRGKAQWIGETYEFRPYGQCVVMFVTFSY